MSKLKPCPFCGGEAIIEENSRRYFSQEEGEYYERDYGVSCSSCNASIGINKEADYYDDCFYSFKTKQEAITAWNRRVKDE